jgi:YidC/Oxa1 family membrane protein insertase
MFFTVFIQPLLNALAFFVWLVPRNDLGLAICLLTVAVRLVLHPFQKFTASSQEKMQRLQPKIEAAKKKFKDAKDKQLEAIMAVYREEGVNPLALTGGNLLVVMIQIPVLLGLFRVFGGDVTKIFASGLYAFTPRPEAINAMFLGLIDLSAPNIVVAALAALAQFWQMRIASKKIMANQEAGSFGAAFQKQSQFLFPLLTIIIGVRLPAALALYWLVFTLLAVASDLWMARNTAKQVS